MAEHPGSIYPRVSLSHPYRPDERNYVPVMIIALAASLVLGRHLVTLLTNG